MKTLTLEQIGRRMTEASPEVTRALVWGLVHPRLRHDTIVRVRMWRDGHMEKTAVDGAVARSGPPGCDCDFCTKEEAT